MAACIGRRIVVNSLKGIISRTAVLIKSFTVLILSPFLLNRPPTPLKIRAEILMAQETIYTIRSADK